MGLAAALEALEHDSKIWRDTSDTLQDCAVSANSIRVTLSDTSIAGSLTGFTDSYADIQQQVVRLLSQGARETERMRATMKRIHDDFEANDEATAARLRGVWEVKG